jgi:hypothetical protein
MSDLPALQRRRMPPQCSLVARFRQAVGVAVRIAMGKLGWRTTGRKGSLGQRARVPSGTTAPGAYVNDVREPARYFSKAEIYRAPTTWTSSDAAESTISPDDAHARAIRLQRLRAGLAQIAQIGTPEERAETQDLLMAALAETRRRLRRLK